MTDPFIVIDKLEKNYGDHHAVRGIDLSIAAGEFIAVMGPSGCGKSTLLRMIAGLEDPTGGDIRIVGKSVLDVPAHERGTPMVWQSLALFPFLTVAQNIAFPLRMKQVPPGEQRRRVMEWVDRLGLSGMEDRDIARLSGGQRQRVAIARALITQPSILLLDEPLSALDAHLRVRMQTELARLHKQLGITFIYVTHAQSEAFALADRVVIMSEGKIQQSGRPEDVYRAPANAFVADFIGMNNRIAGKPETIEEGRAGIRTPYGRFRPADHATLPEASVEFVIAADRVGIGATEPADPSRDRVRGTVLGQEFVGSTQTIFVEVENGPEFRVQKQQHDLAGLDLSPGAPVWLSWNPAETWVLPEQIR